MGRVQFARVEWHVGALIADVAVAVLLLCSVAFILENFTRIRKALRPSPPTCLCYFCAPLNIHLVDVGSTLLSDRPDETKRPIHRICRYCLLLGRWSGAAVRCCLKGKWWALRDSNPNDSPMKSRVAVLFLCADERTSDGR
jgi:hypothetical protein